MNLFEVLYKPFALPSQQSQIIVVNPLTAINSDISGEYWWIKLVAK